MVWSQYVYEASVGTEAHSSDDEHTDSEENNPLLNIHTYYDAYSDELWFLWDVMQESLRDAFLEHDYDELHFHDWLEFCFTQSERRDDVKRVEHAKYLWRLLNREDHAALLQKKTLGDFEEFLLSYSIPIR